ncbi:class I SAM-dependent methyltransferase [bacterium]|nr:class I SAM-dependent methyltransferase [bacterium]
MERLLKKATGLAARNARLFDALRWVLEGGYRGELRVIRDEVRPHGGRVLDVGCGTGIFAACFPPGQYTGIDVSEGYIEAARRKHPGHTFACHDACAMPFAQGSFDVCIVSGVLHHLDDETAVRLLRELARVLKNDGSCIIWEDVPARSRWNVIGAFAHRFDEGSHIRLAEAYRRLASAAFSVARAYPMRSGFMDYEVLVCHQAGRNSGEA